MLGCPEITDNIALSDVLAEPCSRVEKYLRMCRGTREAVPTVFSFAGADGNCVRYAVRGTSLKSGDPGNVGLYFEEKSSSSRGIRFKALNRTIGELQQEIKSRHRIEALLDAEKRTMSSVFEGQPLFDALGILARAVEAHSNGMLMSILLVDDNNCLRHAVAPSLPDDYVSVIDGIAVGPDVGSCGTAAYSGATVIVSDVNTDHRWVDFRDTAATAGLRACWSSPIMASNGAVLGTLAMYFRTPRLPTDDELRLISNSAHIASTVIERFRSQELLKEMLGREKSARVEAESRDQAKDEFLAMLGHELRNPLGAITNAALAMENGDLVGQSAGSLLKIILAESRLLKRILDDLLDLSRLSRGKLQLRKELFSVDEFFAELIAATRTIYPDRDIAFEVQDDLGQMSGDRSRLSQSVHNLVNNAVKYSQAGDEITVRISADSTCLRLTVSDAGLGIEPALLETIFDPFVQSDKSIARSNSGLGLGLALVKRFTEMHGGNVSASSDGKGLGSQFTLTIPRGDVNAVKQAASWTHTSAESSPKKVLVVEDNENAREGLCRILQLWGHEVLSAANGQEALDVITDARPDVALIDIGLPVIDGYEVARSVREDPGMSSMTLVALTGYGQASDCKRALDAGFDQHLVKPADIDDLIKILGAPAT